MISKHVGGEIVKGGIYWSLKDGEFVTIPREGGRLPGGSRDSYIKAPLPVVLVVGPVMGLAFAIFLPLSGLLVLVPFLFGKLRGAMVPSAAHAAAGAMQPGVSYLEPQPRGTAQGQHTPDGTVENGKLVDLAKEIAERRWQERRD